MTSQHWSRMARLWQLVGPPLRPAAQDRAAYHGALGQWRREHARPPRALILGVTPELHALDWPAGTSLLALDASPQMIEAVWPGPAGTALRGSWTAMPLAAASRDIVLCDGGFGMLSYPHGQAALLRELRRVLAPGGIFAARLFAPKGRTGNADEVFARLAAGDIASLDALKLQLWGALHGSPEQGVQPQCVVAHILAAVGGFDRLAADHGWSLEHTRSLELHRASQATYFLTDAAEMVRMAGGAQGGFECLDIVEPDYELGACCPIVTLRCGG
ncbi:MAG: class I SAM-dependent methyltransferase [Betaproteobacteria bacterium]|jgi:SAM-dependent methyltransferase|nr:class I SAM-dependent methyltransferase [Betaproteobacteria bacterium]